MRKRIIGAVAAVPLVLGSMAGPVAAEVNAVTPSTNDANKLAGYAYFDAVAGEDKVDLTFTTVRAFDSCFEYRADGAATTETAANPNTLVTDGLWAFTCVRADVEGTAKTATVTVPATDYVEVRLVFGAETDERFDWTKVETLEPVVTDPVVTDPVVTEPVPPQDVADCKKGGWKAAGYSNQGRCVSAVRKLDNIARQEAKKAALAEKTAAKAAAKGAKVKGKKK